MSRLFLSLLAATSAASYAPISSHPRFWSEAPLAAPPASPHRRCPFLTSVPARAAPLAAVRDQEEDATSLSSRSRFLAASAATGACTGAAVSGFKLSIVACAVALFGADTTAGWTGCGARRGAAMLLLPAVGGVAVAVLRALSPGGRFGPGLAEHVAEVESGVPLQTAAFATRVAASAVTLGSGNSLGPEGPSVEIGCGVARLVGSVAARRGWKGAAHLQRRSRQMLAVGAAAGVAAGFNAPLAGVFFALEIVAVAVRSAVDEGGGGGGEADAPGVGSASEVGSVSELEARRDSAELDAKSRTAISGVVLSSLVSAVVAQEVLGSGHALPPGGWPVRLRWTALPVYAGLGAVAGVTALAFKRTTAALRALFVDDGAGGGGPLRAVPPMARPALGGLCCGAIGLAFPQVLFSGYATLDAIVQSLPLSAATLNAALGSPLAGAAAGGGPALPGAGLLVAKLVATSGCVASGLVGGTFAPSLLLGASLGVVYHQVVVPCRQAAARALALLASAVPALAGATSVANAPTFAMVGGAAFLSSVFGAPLTSALLLLEALLLFELTRGYELVLPLLCAAGTGPVVMEGVEQRLDAARRRRARRSSGEASGEAPPAAAAAEQGAAANVSASLLPTVPPDCDVDYQIVCRAEP